MTAMHAELHPFRLVLRNPLVTGGVSIRFRAGFLVSLHGDGLTGWGEASPLPGWSRNTLLQTEAALRSALDGLDAGDEGAIDAVIASLEDAPHARAGLAGAWADTQAQRASRTLAEHLIGDTGQLPPPAVSVNALVAAVEPSHVEQAVRQRGRERAS